MSRVQKSVWIGAQEMFKVTNDCILIIIFMHVFPRQDVNLCTRGKYVTIKSINPVSFNQAPF